MGMLYTFFSKKQPTLTSFKKVIFLLLVCFLFNLNNLQAQASANFEAIAGATMTTSSPDCRYFDADQTTVHEIQNFDPGGTCVPITVNSIGNGSNLGFSIILDPTPSAANGSSGFSDGDGVGVATNTTLLQELGLVAPEGVQGFLIEDTDGEVVMTFDKVNLAGTSTPMASVQYFLSSTGWEVADFLNIHIEITECASATSISLINTTGMDIDGLSIEGGAFKTLSANLTAHVGCKAQLVIEHSSNSASEELGIDNIIFTEGTGIPLPVELISFDAHKKDNAIHLSWKTATEINNDYFLIERSQDGRVYESIGEVEGYGYSYEAHGYSFLDKKPQAGLNFYRLRQVDYDGKEEVHKVVSVMIEKGNAGIQISPNPGSNIVQLRLAEPATAEVSVKMFDISGRLVYESTIEARSTQGEMDVSPLAKGIYVLQIQNGQVIDNQRFVKN